MTLASNLDDIADFIWGAVKQMENYQFFAPGDTTEVFANRLHQHMKHLAEAIREIRNPSSFPGLGMLCRELTKEMRNTETIVDDALIRVFSDGQNFLDSIKRIDHYEMLHNILEKSGTVVRTIEVVVVKYG